MPDVLFGIDDANPSFGTFESAPEWGLLEELLATFPNLKITHFIPAHYSMRFGKVWGLEKRIRRLMGLPLPLWKNPHTKLDDSREWCEKFQTYPQFEAGLHGLFHVNEKNGSAQEFVGLTQEETDARVDESIRLFHASGFSKPKIMAPPGWGVTRELIRTLAHRKISFAGNFVPIDSTPRAGWTIPSGSRVEKVDGVVNIPRNISIETFSSKAVDLLIEKEAIIGLHGHFRNIGVRNGITRETVQNVQRILEQAEKHGKLRFRFMGEYA